MSEPTTETPAAGTAATAVIDAPEGKTFSAEAMHRARQEAAAARAELAEIKKAREAEEAAKLADEKKWQDLYTAEQKKREKAEAESAQQGKDQANAHQQQSAADDAPFGDDPQ